MNARPSRAEIWQVDMGIAGKVRPCLLLTDYPANDELALVTVIPHTTALRGNEWEVAIPKPFLKEGVYRGQALIIDIQGGRRGSAEIDKIIDGKIIKNHNRAPGRA